MQSPRLIQQTGRAQRTSFRPPDFRSPSFHKLVFANQGNQESRPTDLLREDHYTPEYVPNGVRWKNLLRRHESRRLPTSTLEFVSWSWRRDLNP